MGGKNAKQKAQTGTCGYWPYSNFLSCGYPNFFNSTYPSLGFDCFSPFTPFCGLNGYNGLFGCGFDGLNCYNGISPLALPYNPCPFPQTTGKLAMTYNGAKLNLKW